METKINVAKTDITHHKDKNKIDTVNKIYKPQASKSKVYKSISNESNKGMALDKLRLLDKSRYSQKT